LFSSRRLVYPVGHAQPSFARTAAGGQRQDSSCLESQPSDLELPCISLPGDLRVVPCLSLPPFGRRYPVSMTADLQRMAEHLKLVQGVITRMAGNSAQMKMWAVSLVAAVFVFSGLSDDPHWLVGVGGCVPVIALWGMDARYLHLERCYVRLYEAVVVGRKMTPFELDYRPYATEVDSV